jgi:hypothetical protein
MQAQLYFDREPLKHGIPVTRAIIAVEKPVTNKWPLGAIQDGLTYCYQKADALPRIHVVSDSKGFLGYIVRPEHLEPDHVMDVFWQVLVEAERAEETKDGYNFESNPKLVAQGWDGGLPAAVIAYRHVGVSFPAEPFNHAVETLMGQDEWPHDAAVWPYPVQDGHLYITTLLNDVDTPAVKATVKAEFARVLDSNPGYRFHDPHPAFTVKEPYELEEYPA